MAVESEPTIVQAENPIESFVCEDLVIIEGTKGFYTQGYDEKTGSYQQYYYYHATPTFKITLKDGTIIDRVGQFEYNGETHYISYSANNQSYNNQWTAGNTYTATASLWGVSVEYDVTIVESPVESVVCKPMKIVENTNGYFSGYYDEQTGEQLGEYFYYNAYPEFTVTFKDGTVMEYQQGGINYNDEWHSFEVLTTQSYQNQWKAGNQYKVTGSMMGITCEYTVDIISCPIASFECKDWEVIEGTHGRYAEDYNFDTQSYDPEYFYYNCDPIFDVTFIDGTKLLDQRGGFDYNGTHYSINCSMMQSYSNQWEVGNTYSVETWMLGKTDYYNVTITESPVESIAIEDIKVEEGSSLSYVQEWDFESERYVEYPVYDYYVEGGTVTMKDGTTYELNGTRFDYNGEQYEIYITDDQSYRNRWERGVHNATVRLMGAGTTINVEVVEPSGDIEIPDEEPDYVWDAFDITVTSDDEMVAGNEVELYVSVKNDTGEKLSFLEIYHWYYQEWDNSETYPGVEFGVLTDSEGNVLPHFEEIDTSFEVDEVKEFVLRGTLPDTWNEKSEITFVIASDVGTTRYHGQADYSGDVQVEKPEEPERPEVLVGDLDGDGYVTSDDAIYLLYHTINGTEYPVNQNVDFDGNGHVTSDDAIYLLYQVMLPEEDDNESGDNTEGDTGSENDGGNPGGGSTGAGSSVGNDDEGEFGAFF